MAHCEFLLASQMTDFYVLGSDIGFLLSPPGSLLDHAGYTLCGQYQVSRVTCQPGPISARYVYIKADVPAARNILEICEVWVYGSKFQKQ